MTTTTAKPTAGGWPKAGALAAFEKPRGGAPYSWPWPSSRASCCDEGAATAMAQAFDAVR